MRILFAGPAGTGKSTIAEIVAKNHNIPFLKSKDITNSILKRDGYDYASGVQVETFLQTKARQIEILNKTLESIKTEAFITDRGLVDLAAYAMDGLENLEATDIDRILCMCQASIKTYTHIFLFKPGELVDNQKRTMNKHYQNLIYTLELGILHDWKIPFILIEDFGMEIEPKVNLIMEHL